MANFVKWEDVKQYLPKEDFIFITKVKNCALSKFNYLASNIEIKTIKRETVNNNGKIVTEDVQIYTAEFENINILIKVKSEAKSMTESSAPAYYMIRDMEPSRVEIVNYKNQPHDMKVTISLAKNFPYFYKKQIKDILKPGYYYLESIDVVSNNGNKDNIDEGLLTTSYLNTDSTNLKHVLKLTLKLTLSTDKSEKRSNYISWQEYFMGIAQLSAMRSKDPSTQVGCCIVKDNRIVGIGYNGFPRGCSDDVFPWNSQEEEDPLQVKDHYVVHAEMNAILNSHINDLKDSEIYVTLFPCNNCMKAIIQVGIKKIYYMEKRNSISLKASIKMMKAARIQSEQFIPKKKLYYDDPIGSSDTII